MTNPIPTRCTHLTALCLAMLCVATAVRAGEANGYDIATAHDPHFSDRAVWPESLQTDRAAYAKETWTKGRVLTWTTTDPKASRGLNPADPANWTENGKPATEPLDADCDVIFPSAKTSYVVQQGDCITPRPCANRAAVAFAAAVG